MSKQPEFDPAKPILLIGEGLDDVKFFSAIAQSMGRADIAFWDYGGKFQLGDALAGLVVAPGFENVSCLAVTRDADDDPAGTWASVRSHMENAGLSVAASPAVVAPGRPSSVGFIVPPTGPGALEEWLLESLSNDPRMACADAYFDCARTNGAELPDKMGKHRFHVWSAGHKKVATRAGIAIEMGYVDLSSPVFDPARSFINELR